MRSYKVTVSGISEKGLVFDKSFYFEDSKTTLLKWLGYIRKYPRYTVAIWCKGKENCMSIYKEFYANKARYDELSRGIIPFNHIVTVCGLAVLFGNSKTFVDKGKRFYSPIPNFQV